MVQVLTQLSKLATVTTAVTPTLGRHNSYNAASGPLAPVLPPLTTGAVATALAAGQVVRLKISKSKTDASANAVTVTCAGADTFEGGAASQALTLAGEKLTLTAATVPGGAGPTWVFEEHSVPRDTLQTYLSGTFGLVTDLRPASRLDFTTKPDGAAPTVDDVGNAVSSNKTTGQNPVKIVGGKLVADPIVASSYTSYYQVNLGGADGQRIGAEFTISANDGGVTGVCIALWDRFNFPTTAVVPQARCHCVLVPGTGVWTFWVCDGAGHLVQVTTGSFVQPPFDDTTVWHYEVEIDDANGNAYIWLPDGSIARVSAAQIAATIAGTGGWAAGSTLNVLSGKWAMIEHATSAADSRTAIFPKYTQMWAETALAPRSRRATNPRAVARAVTAATVAPDPTYRRVGAAGQPAFMNGWTTAGSNPAAFRKMADGTIKVRGYFQTGSANLSIFTLPVGYRPTAQHAYPGVTSTGAFCYVFINTDGTVQPATAGPMWFEASFDPIY